MLWRRYIYRLLKTPGNLERILDDTRRTLRDLECIKLNQGKIYYRLMAGQNSIDLQDYEFRVFSQWGEDGIIQKLISSIPIVHKTFIEFGVESFSEANCRYLMMNNNWSGFVMDGSAQNINALRNSDVYWKYDLRAVEAFVTRDNINALLARSGFDPDLGILSIDIDGVDYWVLEAISDSYRPRIIIAEYNAVFGCTRAITVPYDPAFNRTNAHYSNLYFGASLPALTSLANKRGYELVGTNSAGVNAFFVRRDLINPSLRAITAEEGYTASRFSESRDRAGNLTYIGGEERLKTIRGMPVINITTGAEEAL